MKKTLVLFLAAGTLAVFSCKRANDLTPSTNPLSGPVLVNKAVQAPVPDSEPMPKAQLDKTVKEYMHDMNDFQWKWVDLNFIWSAAQYGNHDVAVGYKPANVVDVTPMLGNVNIQSPEWKSVHDAIIALVVDELSKQTGTAVNLKDILVEDDQYLPILTFKLTDKNVMTKLYNLENVRCLEPMDYWPDQDRSASGCNSATETLNTADWTITTPNCRVPWNYNNLNVPNAWNTAQGQGVQIGIIDAGISSSQPLLGSDFNNGESNVGRTVTTDYTYGTTAFTSCTHGTSMCGLATGPRNNQNTTTGVAYKANLYFIRGSNDVVLDESAELSGYKNALVKMGNTATVKIISMSNGTPFSSSVLHDGITYASNKGKLLMAAAGTSYSWTSWWGVIYPAAYSECIAITGVKENGNTCTVCHDGSQVKFTVPMERNVNSNRNSLSLMPSGYSTSYIGGSSCATATAAGIAALVWSVNPNLTKSQVFDCLKQTAQYYPNVTSNHGYGNLNAAAAVTMASGL